MLVNYSKYCPLDFYVKYIFTKALLLNISIVVAMKI